MHFVVFKPTGHGSCIMGHWSVVVWVSGSWVTAYDPLPALTRLATANRNACQRSWLTLSSHLRVITMQTLIVISYTVSIRM